MKSLFELIYSVDIMLTVIFLEHFSILFGHMKFEHLGEWFTSNDVEHVTKNQKSFSVLFLKHQSRARYRMIQIT